MPAAGRVALTRLYDPAIALTVRERTFRSLLVEQILRDLSASSTVIDVGCGTGTLAIELARALPEGSVLAVDGDESVLGLARRKEGASSVQWEVGLAGSLQLEDASADAVVMSLLLHHLEPDSKLRALADARRVLRPGGVLHVADWGRPHDPLMRGAFLLLQTLDGFSNTRDHVSGRLHQILHEAGYASVVTHHRLRTMWGTLELLSARQGFRGRLSRSTGPRWFVDLG